MSLQARYLAIGQQYVWFPSMTIFFFSYPLRLLTLSFQSTIPAIDEILVSMTDIDPVHRLDAKEAKDKLGAIVNSMTPESLLIKPKTLRDKHGLPNIPLK